MAGPTCIDEITTAADMLKKRVASEPVLEENRPSNI